MADEKQLEKLLGDTDAWNEWRQQEPNIKVDLSDSSLTKSYLVGVDLQDANLSNSDLSHADLSHADLSGANLVGANLDMANLSHSVIYGVNLSHAKLTSVDIRDADLANVRLYKTALANTDLSEAKLYDISFEEDSKSFVSSKEQEQENINRYTGNSLHTNKAVILSAATALASIDEFVDQLRENNKFSVEYPEHKDSLLLYLSRLQEGLEKLIEQVEIDASVVNVSDSKELEAGYYYKLIKEIEGYLSPEYRAKITVPAVLTFSCGALGALLGGPIGFGAGSMSAAYLLGQSNSKALADKVQDAISIDN